MPDIIYIKNLKVDTIIGVYDWERKVRQVVNIDVDIATDIHKAAESEDIKFAVDYGSVSKRLTEFIQCSEFFLIETMAERISEIILHEFNAPWLRLRIGKPGAVNNASDVGVIIERGKKI